MGTWTEREGIDMDNFAFYSPTYFAFGNGEEKKTGALVRRFGGSRVLLVMGGGSVKKIDAYEAVTDSLKKADLPFVELWGVQPNPRSGKVYEGIELVRKENLDFILALGGGSVIDTAKAIAFGAVYEGDFWEVFDRSGDMPEHTMPPMMETDWPTLWGRWMPASCKSSKASSRPRTSAAVEKGTDPGRWRR